MEKKKLKLVVPKEYKERHETKIEQVKKTERIEIRNNFNRRLPHKTDASNDDWGR